MDDGRWDLARQVANLVGALFQVAMTVVASAGIQEVVERGPGSLVEPAAYAFAIWAVIFALSLVYAVYGALPANRENPLLRRIGWYAAGAFACTGLWSVFVLAELLLFAQAMLIVIFVCLVVAYLRLAHSERSTLSTADRWLVALPLAGSFLRVDHRSQRRQPHLRSRSTRDRRIQGSQRSLIRFYPDIFRRGTRRGGRPGREVRTRAKLPVLRLHGAVGSHRGHHDPVRCFADYHRRRTDRRSTRRAGPAWAVPRRGYPSAGGPGSPSQRHLKQVLEY